MTNPADLKNIGLKATLPRLKILEIFQHSPVRHLTAEDVYRNLLHEELDIGLATVYRVLTQFEQAGLLSRSNFESGKAVFELNEGSHHDHLVCLDCGRWKNFSTRKSKAVSKTSRRNAVSSCTSTRSRCMARARRNIARTGRTDFD